MLDVKMEPPRWHFYPLWVMLNFISVVAAWYAAWALMSLVTSVIGDTIEMAGRTRITEDYLYMYLLLPAIGALMGLVQYALLRRYLQRIGWWPAATLLGWLLPILYAAAVTAAFGPRRDAATGWVMLAFSVLGAIVALPQWWLLRTRVTQAWWWLVSSGIGWGLVGSLNWLTSEPLVVLATVGLLPPAATGAACWLLLGRQRRSPAWGHPS